jgi:aspartyl/asparaginyl-tRNA synthetase
MSALIDPREFTRTVDLLRDFFKARGFLEVHTQNRLSILAACEDPTTVATFDYAGQVWPLPQTGQMWLEWELLRDPALKGLFCVSTSYREEPNPIPGRHDLIFPMFEFEMPGDFEDLLELEKELCRHLKLEEPYGQIDYADAARQCNVKELEAEHEEWLCKEKKVVFLTNFPIYTSPFWNMKKSGELSKKVDVLIHGIETIGSAERSTNPDEMRDQFHTISNGMYAQTLYAKFGKERVERELEDFLKFHFFPRVGGGIGVTRLISGLRKESWKDSRDT